MKKRNYKIILILTLILIIIPFSSTAQKEPVKIEYFGVDACITCVKADKHLYDVVNKLESQGYDIELVKHDIKEEKSEDRLISLNNALNVPNDQYKLIPAIFIGDKYLIDINDIESELEELIIEASNIGQKNIEAVDSDFRAQEMSVLGIFLAGLIDGVNPCSIAMMLFFISMIIMDHNRDKRSITKIGLSFSLGVFIAYLSIGVGIFNFIYIFNNIPQIMIIFYLILLTMGSFLFYLNMKDYYYIKKGKDENIKNQLNRNTKKRIHNYIRDKISSRSKNLYLLAFIVAFVISFMEFFCTGQIYLPTITYMIKNSKDYSYIFMLVIYNVGFIIPLLVITGALRLGKEVIDISSILLDKLHIIKIIGAIFFLLVVIYSAHQLSLLI